MEMEYQEQCEQIVQKEIENLKGLKEKWIAKGEYSAGGAGISGISFDLYVRGMNEIISFESIGFHSELGYGEGPLHGVFTKNPKDVSGKCHYKAIGVDISVLDSKAPHFCLIRLWETDSKESMIGVFAGPMSGFDVTKMTGDGKISMSKRNDLSIYIYNDTSESVHVRGEYLEHGKIDQLPSTKEIKKPKLKNTPPYFIFVQAENEGCNLTLNLEMPDQSGLALMAATPVNKENYVKIRWSKEFYKSSKDAYSAADDKGKTHASHTPITVPCGDTSQYNVEVELTKSSPCICHIYFKSAS